MGDFYPHLYAMDESSQVMNVNICIYTIVRTDTQSKSYRFLMRKDRACTFLFVLIGFIRSNVSTTLYTSEPRLKTRPPLIS